jgi:integrase
MPSKFATMTDGVRLANVLKSVRRGRKRLWPGPHVPVCDADWLTAQALEETYGAGGSQRTRERVSAEFEEFVCRNAERKIEQSDLARERCRLLPAWIGQLRRCGLKPGTVNTYLGYLTSAFAGTTNERRELKKWKKIVALAHADEVEKENPVPILERHDVRDLLQRYKAAEIPVELHALLWTLATTGARIADLARLRRSDLAFAGTGRLQIRFRVTKTRRNRWMRTIIKFDLFLGAPPPRVLKFLSSGNKLFRPFGAWSASSFNTELQEREGVDAPRSRFFRKFFINYWISVFGYTAEGLEKVRKKSGHFQAQTLEAYYLDFSANGTPGEV